MPAELSDMIEPIAPPKSEAELGEVIRAAHDAETPVYPVGGGTGLHFGQPIRKPGWGVSTQELNQVVDYPAADMTITVGTGMTIDALQAVLAEHQQQLPLDIAAADQATLGGVLATNAYGHRRFGYGTARDYVIGIRAVDGRGSVFAGGGRVVKNVAGYDFCKLLVGSHGTLGVISEVTLKLKPIPPARAAIVVAVGDTETGESILAGLVASKARPIAIDWLVGAAWDDLRQAHDWPTGDAGQLFIVVEGTQAEVEWSRGQLLEELKTHVPGDGILEVEESSLPTVQQKLVDFGSNRDAALIGKASILPGEVHQFVSKAKTTTPAVSIQAHAGNGIVLLAFDEYPDDGVGGVVTGQWQPWASQAGGNICILHNREYQEATTRTSWGTPSSPVDVMRKVKQQFDPRGILNPGRFIV